MRPLTIFWTALSRTDVESLEDAVRDRDAVLAQVSIGVLPVQVVPALASGAVIMICASNKEATLALAAGVDEVLRSGELTRDVLDAAISRARARADARALRNGRRALLEEEQDVALTFLRTALNDELAAPLTSAVAEVDRLSRSLPAVLEAEDDFVAWTRSTDRETPRRIAARRLAAPSSEELRKGISRLRQALQQASDLSGALRQSRAEAQVSASDVVRAVVDAVGDVVSYADIAVETTGPCYCVATRGVIVLAVTTLMARGLEAIRSRGLPSGTIAVRAFNEEDAVVVEVQDNGEEIRADLRPGALDPYFRDVTHPRSGLIGLRDRVRAAGGDMVVDTGPVGTLVRVIFPVEGEFFASEPTAAKELRKPSPD